MGEYSFQGIYPDLDWGKNKTWLLKMLEQQKQPERETKKEKTLFECAKLQAAATR